VRAAFRDRRSSGIYVRAAFRERRSSGIVRRAALRDRRSGEINVRAAARRARGGGLLWRSAAAALLVAVGLASEAHAQTLPLPEIPAPLPTPPGPDEPAWEATRRWEYSFSLAPTYDTNVGFGSPGTGDFTLSPAAVIARVFPGAKGRLRVRGSALGYVYREQRTFNRAEGDGGFDFTRALAEGATWRGDFSAGVGYTDSSRVLSEQGVALPPSRMTTVEGTTDLEVATGRRSTLTVSGRVYGTRFDDPLLVDSLSTRGSLTLGRRVGERSTLAIQYGAEYSQLEVSAVSHVGSLQVEGLLSEHSAFLIEGGVSYTQAHTPQAPDTPQAPAPPQAPVTPWNPYGGVSLTREVGRSRIVLYARREVVPSFGLGGLQLSDRFGIRVSAPFGRWWLDLEGYHVAREITEGTEAHDETSDWASLGLRRGLGKRWALGLQGQYRRRGPVGTSPAVDGLLAALVLSVSNPGANGM
jgi:hypothetical protein